MKTFINKWLRASFSLRFAAVVFLYATALAFQTNDEYKWFVLIGAVYFIFEDEILKHLSKKPKGNDKNEI